jgi:hypothetical protein
MARALALGRTRPTENKQAREDKAIEHGLESEPRPGRRLYLSIEQRHREFTKVYKFCSLADQVDRTATR